MQLIHWKELGGPSRPGHVTLCDGVVDVRQHHIDLASKHGGQCSFKLDETGALIGSAKAEYHLGRSPYPDRNAPSEAGAIQPVKIRFEKEVAPAQQQMLQDRL